MLGGLKGARLRLLPSDERPAMGFVVMLPKVRLAVQRHPLQVRGERRLVRGLLLDRFCNRGRNGPSITST
jgi:hypothetical protein